MPDEEYSRVDVRVEQFAKLRAEALVQIDRETAARVERHSTPTEEEVRAGAFREMIEPQVRDAIFTMRRKGYATESSGFGGEHGEIQQVDGNFEIDAETEARLRTIQVTVHRRGDPGEVLPWTTALRFAPDAPSLVAMEAKWKAAAALLPDRGQKAAPGVGGGTEDFIRQYAPERTDVLDRIVELREAYAAEQRQAMTAREMTEVEAAARREHDEKSARARELGEARRLRTELGRDADPTIAELQTLILSADAEAQVSREFGERGEAGPHLFRGVDGERRLTVFGTAHVFERAGVRDLRRVFKEDAPDLVLREGTVDFTIDPSLGDDQVLERYGEQVYLERLARARGIEVRSWDVPWVETMRDVLREGHEPDAIIAWMISQGTKHVLNQGRAPSRETLADVLKVVCTPEMVEALERDTGVSLDVRQLDLDRIAQEYLGKSLAELDFETAEAHATPWRRGPTNDVLRRMNELRDAHAIALIAEAKRAGRHTFVLAGGDHVLAWQPALEALYPQHEFETLAEPRATETELPLELQRSFLRVWSEIVSGRPYEDDPPASHEQLTTTLRGMVTVELDGHLELLARQQGKELPSLPELRDGTPPEEQLAFVRALTAQIHAVQNENTACLTPRLSRELNGMDCSMSTWVMQHELAKTDIPFEWGSPVGHAVGIVTLRNGERYYADGQGGFVERIDTIEHVLPKGGRVVEIANWRDIQARRPAFFPQYVFVMPNSDVESTIANVDSMLYKQHLGSITDAQRKELGQEDARTMEQLQPYALSVQDALRPFATGERDGDGHEVSPLNRILEAVFPASDAMYQRPEFRADESRMLTR